MYRAFSQTVQSPFRKRCSIDDQKVNRERLPAAMNWS
ncbi:hypothetical protein HDG34_004028 [Paraburkholderia sp. HC6.4b]|nr:hypothetical protein [Paraburkholderia sp. HC6.4b]MBB5452010.1 hypothetical protein [Paraburkholderia sp. Kb1A]